VNFNYPILRLQDRNCECLQIHDGRRLLTNLIQLSERRAAMRARQKFIRASRSMKF